MRSHVRTVRIATLLTLAAATSAARAQLREFQVAVVYDSRIPDSLAVAEYYAGSGKVPGGAGGIVGARPNVNVINLASIGAPAPLPGEISYPDFITRLRDPIRQGLTNAGLVGQVRCLVLTKGLPHRLWDFNAGNVGDFVNTLIPILEDNNASFAAVDSELTLLWQNLSAGEANGFQDSYADGAIINPYWKSLAPHGSFSNDNAPVAKVWTGINVGPQWNPGAAVGNPARSTAGDMMLVSRLDANTLADVRAIIDRARNLYVNTTQVTFLLDESGSNGVKDAAANGEFDNTNTTFTGFRDQDDYEATRDALTADKRWTTAKVRYNALAGVTQFYVGPRLAFAVGHGLLVTDPVLLLATYGSNHNGVPNLADGTTAGTVYASSYNYPNGAVFNTIESYNGRAFGGLAGASPSANQQQLSGFLAAGGTFGLANAWEPLADTVPDNRLIAENFFKGTLSWGEAAWSACPALSWQQFAVGDPLARVQRSSEDVNADGRVDINDLYLWETLPTGDARKDVDKSGVADANDRALILKYIRAFERSDIINARR